MNQKEFLNLIDNENAIELWNLIKKLLEQDDLSHNNKKEIKLIEDNFEKILRNRNDYAEIYFVSKFMTDSRLKIIILNKLDIIIKILYDKKRDYDVLSFSVVSEIFEEGGIDFIEKFIKNIKSLLPNIAEDDLFELCQLVKKAPSYNAEISDILNEKLENNKKLVAKSLLKKLGPSIYNRQINIDMIEIILDELIENEGIRMIDIDYIGKGAFSKVYKIGEMVLKIGRARRSYEIPNHPRILQPLVRKNLKDKNGYIEGCVEVSNFVRCIKKIEPGIKEEIYQLYKELRKDGLIWADADYKNIGRLNKKNNNIYYIKRNGDEPINVAPEAVGLEGELKGRILDKGELVILDSDYIFSDDGPELTLIGDMAEELEERYQRELKGITMDGMNFLSNFQVIDTKMTPILPKEYDER